MELTCDIIVCPEVHFNVVPLENHTTLCGWSSNGHVDVILVTECVDRQRLCIQGLMEDEICKTSSAFLQTARGDHVTRASRWEDLRCSQIDWTLT